MHYKLTEPLPKHERCAMRQRLSEAIIVHQRALRARDATFEALEACDEARQWSTDPALLVDVERELLQVARHSIQEVDAVEQTTEETLREVKRLALRDRLADNPHALISLGLAISGWIWIATDSIVGEVTLADEIGANALFGGAFWAGCVGQSRAYPRQSIPTDSKEVLPLRWAAVTGGLLALRLLILAVQGVALLFGAIFDWITGYELIASFVFRDSTYTEELLLLLAAWLGVHMGGGPYAVVLAIRSRFQSGWLATTTVCSTFWRKLLHR